MTLRQLIQDARTKTGMTQAQFSFKLGVDVGTYSRWERGAHTPGRPTLLAIIALADLPADYFDAAIAA